MERTKLSGGRRFAVEIAILAALGVTMGVLGPYGTIEAPDLRRHIYWLASIIGGGLIGIAIDRAVGDRLGPLWRRVLAVSILMTPPVMVLVTLLNFTVMRLHPGLPQIAWLIWQVFVVSLLVMAVRALAWRQPPPVVETRVVVQPPLPEAERVFRQRLSARVRTARLIAIEADDHYLHVHTDAGVEMITARLADALDELSAAHGLRVHRSWWVAVDAIENVRWRRGVGEARLARGVVAPVSRSYAAAVKEAGWF